MTAAIDQVFSLCLVPLDDYRVALTIIVRTGSHDAGGLAVWDCGFLRFFLKANLKDIEPTERPNAFLKSNSKLRGPGITWLPVDAGTMYKFVHVIKAGDLVIYPSKSDRMVNIGHFTGTVRYHEDDLDGYAKGKDQKTDYPATQLATTKTSRINNHTNEPEPPILKPL